MGFFSNMSKIGSRNYRAVKRDIGSIYRPIRKVAHQAGIITRKVNNSLITIGRKVPEIKPYIDILRYDPIYQAIYQGIKSGTEIIDKTIPKITSDADKVITEVLKDVKYGDKILSPKLQKDIEMLRKKLVAQGFPQLVTDPARNSPSSMLL